MIFQILASTALFVVLLWSFQEPKPILHFNVQRLMLDNAWEFCQEGKNDWKSAEVPGVVHTDLLRNKMIPDPWYGTNEKVIQWVENKNWIYKTTFELTQEQINNNEINLVFEGLDTYTEVYLNGEKIAQTNNMFRKWQWEISKKLKVGENTLRVVFLSPIKKLSDTLRTVRYELPASSETVDLRVSPYIRKAPYHFGWDWGPRYVTCGIWRPVYLELVELAKIEDVQVYQEQLNKKSAIIQVDLSLHIAKNGTYNVVIGGKYKTLFLPKGDTLIKETIHIKNPNYWWPNGWGDAKLYTVSCSIRENNVPLDENTTRIGLRTVELVQEKDKFGESFYFKVNGKKLFVKGANYIPQSNFLPSVTKKNYQSLINDAKVANMNMLRVWGGGIYESDYFYDLCDENGILVWQDFMFANTMYPGDTAFLNNVEQEAIYNVQRLRNHPSIAYWNGNNEIYVAWKGWGWQRKYHYSAIDSAEIYCAYRKLFDTVLREVVKTYDADRQYNPSSPQDSYFKLSYANNGDVHYWGVWHGGHEFLDYRKYIGRFVSEYGFQSFPNMETISKFSDSVDWDINSNVMKWHQKSPVGNEMIALKAEKYFPKATNFREFVQISQQTQALAMQTAINAHRLAKEYCGGTLYWQLNDCWPGPSWSSRDVFGRWKIVHKKLSEWYDEVTLIPYYKNKVLAFYAVNDLPEAIEVRIDFRLKENNQLIWKKTIQTVVANDKAYKIYAINDAKLIQQIKNRRSVIEISIFSARNGKEECISKRTVNNWDVLF
jgi:beta-mannosidase